MQPPWQRRVAAWLRQLAGGMPPTVLLAEPCLQVLSPCLHMPPGAHFGLKDQVGLASARILGGMPAQCGAGLPGAGLLSLSGARLRCC